MIRATYLVALGSNRCHGRHGRPPQLLGAAIARLDRDPVRLIAQAPVISSAPIGPSHRRYANGAVLIETSLAPAALLAWLKAIETEFGRRRGQRWGARALDLDIVLWSGGRHQTRSLQIPHAQLAQRDFVLGPASAIAPRWRIPRSALSLQHLKARLDRSRQLP